MTTTRAFRWALHVLCESVLRVGAHETGEYAIFGSAALTLRGIIDRMPGDIDVLVSRRVWGLVLAQAGWTVLTPNAGDPPILAYETIGHPIHLFFDWRDDAVSIDVPTVIAEAETPKFLRLVRVEEVLRQKRAAFAWGTPGTAKHGPDIAAIEAWLAAGGA